MSSRIIAKIACWAPELVSRSDLNFYLTWLKDQLLLPVSQTLVNMNQRSWELQFDNVIMCDFFSWQNNDYMQSVARCLQMMLRIDDYRLAFISVDGLSTLLSVLSGRVNFQIQYQLVFCIWVLTFNPRLAERMNKYVDIPRVTFVYFKFSGRHEYKTLPSR